MKRMILDEHHIARHCKGSQLTEYDRPMPTAFHLKENEENLSVNWIEFYGKVTFSDGIDRIRRDVQLELRRKARFAVLNVGDAKKEVKTKSPDKYDIAVKHAPEISNPSHSEIRGMNSERAKNEMIAVILAECVRETFLAKV